MRSSQLSRVRFALVALFASLAGFGLLGGSAASAEVGVWTPFVGQNDSYGSAEYRVEPTCAPPKVSLGLNLDPAAVDAPVTRTGYLATISVVVPNPVPAPPEPDPADYASEEDYFAAYDEWVNYPYYLYTHSETIENSSASARNEHSFVVPLEAFEYGVEPTIYLSASVSFFGEQDMPIVAPLWQSQVSPVDVSALGCVSVGEPPVIEPPEVDPPVVDPPVEEPPVIDTPVNEGTGTSVTAVDGSAAAKPALLANTGATEGAQLLSIGLVLLTAGIAIGATSRFQRARLH